MANRMQAQENWSVVCVKDYIRKPKRNGYRSYHLIIQLNAPYDGGRGLVYGEVQLRTLAMDTWASLEHEMKYKRTLPNQAMIVDELRRCADEIASTDLSLQTLRDLMNGSLER